MEPKERFAKVREYTGLSMREFGKQIGLTASSVSSIEYGTRNFNDKHIKLICAAFPQINEEWLRGNSDVMIVDSPDPADLEYYQMQEIRESPALQTIVNVWMQLSPENKELAEKFVASFVADYNARQSAAQIPDNFKKNA